MANGTTKLTDPRIAINNETIQIVPNSFMLTLGFGEDTTDVVSAGNGNTDVVNGTDVSTKKSKGSFDLKNTGNNKTLIKRYKPLKQELVITATDDTDIEVIRKATIINDPEFAYSNDTDVTVEFEGLTSK